MKEMGKEDKKKEGAVETTLTTPFQRTDWEVCFEKVERDEILLKILLDKCDFRRGKQFCLFRAKNRFPTDRNSPLSALRFCQSDSDFFFFLQMSRARSPIEKT